ncbi:MAG TPA: RIP metalloprotease RseP [Candidatus Kapabacteria bacterium]|jgi:regulator of sigma E protease|nr:RIP metalloprotease RseP [Candidatus Kapabacteria bacterium]HPP38782.1 RIP metalloprotease RseP [Candidatus Kapabacteria bacterium]
MGALSDIFYFIIVIGILVLIHELGHFIAARLTGMRAEVFSIGMGWRLFGYNKINGFTFGKLLDDIDLQGHTDYRVAAFPIGGYVKIAGMVDESMDADFSSKPPEKYEFRAKNPLQKAFVLSAGVLFNVILAITIFAGIIFFNGEQTMDTTTVGYVKRESVGDLLGLEQGDRIISINNVPVNNWNDVIKILTTEKFGKNRVVEVLRDNEKVTIQADGSQFIRLLSEQKTLGIEPENTRTIVLAAIFDKPAQKAGLKKDDTIYSINSEPIGSVSQFVDILKANPNKNLFVQWKRGNEILGDSIKPDEKGTIGVQIAQIYLGKTSIKEYGFIESLAFGWNQTVSSVNLLFSSIGQIIKGNMSFRESIGGPIMIAKQAGQQAERGIISFLSFVALLSVSLAVLNILPFPALDGGHLIFVIVEAIMRREVPVKVKMAIQQGGLIILLLFMAFVVYNDLMR